MSRSSPILAGLLVMALAAPAPAQSLPPAAEVDWPRLAEHGGRLLDALDKLQAPLPQETTRSLRELLKKGGKDPSAATEVQKLLDAHCLIGVSINPESRVKAARGPFPADLKDGRETVVLVKVVNEAGVTEALKVGGPQVRAAGEKTEGRWLEASVYAGPPLKKTLSGDRLEYVILRLKPRETGKREATFQFDVGQGTQDLGFRAEVPVLFTVK